MGAAGARKVCRNAPTVSRRLRGHIKKSDSIILGGLFNLKGPQAQLDYPTSLGARLAIDEINRACGVLGKQIQLIAADGKSRPEKLRKVTEKILRQYLSLQKTLNVV